ADTLLPGELVKTPAPKPSCWTPSVTVAPPPDLQPPPPPPMPEDIQKDIQPVQLPQPAPLPSLPTARVLPSGPAEPVSYAALRCFLVKNNPEELEPLRNLGPQEKAALYEQLVQVSAVLRPQAPLAVEKMCFCRRISNYGLYDPLADDHAFLAGVDKRHGELVQLYVEVRNFVNRQNGKFYETALRSRLEIHDKRGLVARMDFPAQPDRSLSPRQDYFIHYQFHVPAMMEPGDEYTLTITLHDDNAPGDAKVARR